MKRLSAAAIIASAALAIAGCSNTQADGGGEDGIGPTNTASGNGTGGTTIPNNSFRALFVASGGILPYPTDLYFLGSNDGTLNVPSAAALIPQNFAAVNKVDGFSVSASNTIRFSEPLSSASLTSASVRVVEATMLRDAATGVYAPVGVRRVLLQGVDYTLRAAPEVDAAGTVLELVPLKPFTSSTGTGTGVGYVVLVTNAVLNASGIAASPDTEYKVVRDEAILEIGRAGTNPAYSPTCPGITNSTLNSICRITFAHLRIGGALPSPLTVNPANVVVSYSFTTQSTRYVLEQIAAVTTPKPIRAVPTGRTTAQLLPGASGIANVLAGTLQIPYYMTPPSAAAPTAPLTANWNAAGASAVPGIASTSRDVTRFNPIPAKVADLNIPLLATVPNASAPGGGVKPAAGWPVIVFQHGFGDSRTNALFVADAYAAAGFVVVAIDQWFHGITDTANPLYAGPANPASNTLYGAGTRERTFDVDYVNNTTFAPGPDGRIDPSGLPNTLIAALQNPLVARDGLRQSGTDLIALVKSLPNLDLSGDGQPDVDGSRIHYIGHSLGGIVGPACVCEQVQSFYLNVPGGSFPEIARTSPSYAPLVNSALAGANPLLQPNTSLYAQFFRDWQLAIDAGDPISLIGRLAQDRPVLLTKVLGDRTVPNPTNDNLIRAASLAKVTQAGVVPIARGTGKFVTFIQGGHSSLLLPTPSAAATAEMQSQAVSLALSGGTSFTVTNGAILEP